MKQKFNLSWVLILLLAITQVTSCKKDKPAPEVISSFTFTIDESDFKTVHFTSTSQNFESLSWNFGDESALSTETNPDHTYAAVGAYTVILTATSSDGSTDEFAANLAIVDPEAELAKLAGEVSKTWKLIRGPSGSRYPLLVMPYDRSSVWWAAGKDNDQIANRSCSYDDTWTFNRDGSMVYDAGPTYWKEGGGYFDPSDVCASTSDMVGVEGDCSAWGSGNHTFVYTIGSEPTLTVNGLGAFVGYYKVGTGLEFKVPQESVTYNVAKLYDGTTDTLIVEAPYKFAATDPNYGGIWQFVLVHYDNPADEPPIPGPAPTSGYTMVTNGHEITFTNTSENANSYLWDFGDGTTSTTTSPVHTFTDGAFNITLTATNLNGENAKTEMVFLTSTDITDALLAGTWKVRPLALSIFVGPTPGSYAWWSVPEGFLTGSGTGGDDWSCIVDDEYTFNAGTYTYATNGSSRNDGYFGGTNGCIDDAGIAASGNGAAFGSSTNTYVLTPPAGDTKAIITLTNGTLTEGGAPAAAFIGFYKGYYGGENTSGANLPNGGNSTNVYQVLGYASTGTMDYLLLSVDLTADHSNANSWDVVLQRPTPGK